MKAKHLLLAGALLLGGATTALANTVTIKFTGVTDAYKHVTVSDEERNTLRPPTPT